MVDTLLELQLPIMLFFQSLRSSVGNALAIAVTYFGDATIAILLLLITYWCIDKRKGFALGATLLPANFMMNILKVIFRVPRPWVKFPDEIDCIYKSTATGYSFPSGHSTTAGALWGSVSTLTKKKWLKIVTVILIVLVPLSRVYLACHWPMDVIVGVGLGLALSLIFAKKMYALYDNEKLLGKVSVMVATITGGVGLVSAILLEGGALEELLWKDLMETSIMCSGLFLGAWLEKTRIGFEIPHTIKGKIIGFILGAVVGIGVWIGIRAIPLFPMIMKCVAYFFLVFWSTFLYPLIAVKLGIFGKESE